MKKDISIKIADLELMELTFKRKVRKQSFDANTIVSYEIKDNLIEFTCDFELKMEKLHIKAKYLYEIFLENITPAEIEEFIKSEQNEIIYPVRCKMSGLVAKITDEINPFPYVPSIEAWNIKELDEEADK